MYLVFLHYSVFIVSIIVLTDSWPFKMEPIGCTETSLRNCNYSLRNNLEERSSHLLLGGSLKSRITCDYCVMSVSGNVVTSCEIADRLRKQSGYLNRVAEGAKTTYTRVGTLIVATIYLQLIQNRYMFRSFTVLQCSHQHCVQHVASDVEVVGYL